MPCRCIRRVCDDGKLKDQNCFPIIRGVKKVSKVNSVARGGKRSRSKRVKNVVWEIQNKFDPIFIGKSSDFGWFGSSSCGEENSIG